MHNLSGVFLEEQEKTNIEGHAYFTFAIVYPKKTRIYYVDKQENYDSWIDTIKRAIGYSNITDNYEVKQKLGNGKFGLVKLGIHKKTGRKVAIKIINKTNMSLEDQGLVKTEIEILKVCQHPNIIKLYDVFENVDTIFISKLFHFNVLILILVMEYCSGGDLFSYIEQRGFRLPEKRACELVNKLAMAISYLHSYGIAHRDLKPENILMTDNTDTADMRLLDFGLSKIIGPNETCTEPYGTLVSKNMLIKYLLF
jgi:serine/threonine protein kinase